MKIQVGAHCSGIVFQQLNPVAEALVPNLTQFEAFSVGEASLRPKQLELPLLLLLLPPLGTTLAPQAGPLLAGERLDEAVTPPAEQLLRSMQPGPQRCQTGEIERGQHQLPELPQAQSSRAPRLIRLQQLPGLNDGPCRWRAVLHLLRGGQNSGVEEMLGINGNQVAQGHALVATLTAKRKNRLAALDGQKTANERRTLENNRNGVSGLDGIVQRRRINLRGSRTAEGQRCGHA